MKYLFIAGVAVLLLPACSPVGLVAGAGASVGVALSQEGGIRTAVTDNAIQLKITELWVRHEFKLYRKLSMTVKEGRVLITGSVPNPDMRVDAVRLAWQADGVRQVLNEITVDEGNGVTGAVSDSWITSSLRTKLMLDKYIESINYNIDTSNGSVYLMGIAQDQKELDRVIDYARRTKHVKNVVNYVRLRYQRPDVAMEPVSN